ncbi:aminotransferase class III-fold pyridoxal phosphate-dependent enzyme [Zavarzinella formosa]|uniref:aminotransferase class III-fold pyridoxal phosphate-dependent enzyme n=1 Tax=Zavarzinella formosa TaxID=360055 RepID=UPI0002F1DAAC|nr:aminotransferase class III-fold pyridoxal phosphate-dependent enzyme [Zavarzinella formosa]
MSTGVIAHPSEMASNAERASAASFEPRSLRTFTPSQAVLSRSAGIYHWTPEGRRLYDFSSGVLVANLGHNPISWTKRFFQYMGWPVESGGKAGFTSALPSAQGSSNKAVPAGFFSAVTMTAYNSITPLETEASKRLVSALRRTPGGGRLHQVMWAASGSEAIQKAIWVGLARDKARPMIIATRYGFHGKKGLAQAITGTEHDSERDPRVKFISFPMKECLDVTARDEPFDPAPYRKELDELRKQFGRKLGMLVTEPYLGGGGSFHPPKEYLQMLQQFCREMDIVFVLDEVQANFGRTASMFAFEAYELEPDIVVLGKGLGNGVPVAAAVGRKDLFASLDYGEASDTWSANPLCCAAVLATLDEFEASDVLGKAKESSAIIEAGLLKMKQLPFVSHIRGERGGMVWGVETKDWGGRSASEWAIGIVLACYRGDGTQSEGIHLLGPLAKKVVRVSPPVIITPEEAAKSVELMYHYASMLVSETASHAHAPTLAGSH